jgi:preprotein translocase subunit Sec63
LKRRRCPCHRYNAAPVICPPYGQKRTAKISTQDQHIAFLHGTFYSTQIIKTIKSKAMATNTTSARDHYATQGVAANAAAELVKAAYRKKATQFHPDKNPSPDAATRFREVQEAYEVISDPVRRKAYDDYRQRSLIDDPLAVACEISAKYIQEILN